MTVKTTMHQMPRRFERSVPAGYRPHLTWGTGPHPPMIYRSPCARHWDPWVRSPALLMTSSR